jgi:hypothetical protein
MGLIHLIYEIMFSQTTYMYKDYGDVFWRWDKSEEFPGS